MPTEAGTSPAIQARTLGRRFGTHWALAHVDLIVPAGEVVLLAGANGSGKTTLLRLIAGLQRPTRGDLEIFGLSPHKDRQECRKSISLVSHQSYLYPQLTAGETVELWCRLLGRKASAAEVADLLSQVSLEDRTHDLVQGFSAGMRKRLSLLRTLIEQPRIVLLDEPFAALDPAGQELVTRWIQEYRERGLTVLMASHLLSRAAELSDRGVVLEHGQIKWIGPPSGAAEQVH